MDMKTILEVNMTKYTYKEVADTLSKVDITGMVETKGRYSYLPWAYADQIMLHFYPEYQVKWFAPEKYEDGTMLLKCIVHIGNLHKEAFLPVYDNSYNAISNPNASDIQDNMQRCMVKAFAKFGLGLSLYQNGSTTPNKLPFLPKEETKVTDDKLVAIQNAKDVEKEIENQLKTGGIADGRTDEKQFGKVLQSS